MCPHMGRVLHQMPRSVRNALARTLRKWWLWLLLLVWELAKDRVAAWANARLDEGVKAIPEEVYSFIVSIATAPLTLTVAFMVLVFCLVFLDAYRQERKHLPISSGTSRAGNETISPIQIGPIPKTTVSAQVDDLSKLDPWCGLKSYTVAQAACLWANRLPSLSFMFQKVMHPEIQAAEQLIVPEFKLNLLRLDSSENALARIGDHSGSYISRDELIQLAQKVGARPYFLFNPTVGGNGTR